MSKQFFSVLLALLRSSSGAWLFGAAFAQLLVASFVWSLHTDHLPLTGVLLMAISGWRRPMTDRFAWRVLPIAPPELAFARWSIMGPAVGLAMTGALTLGAYNNHSFRFPAPALGPQLIALWSAVGYLVWLPTKGRVSSYLSAPRVIGVGLLVLLLLLGAYGYPLRPGWRLPSFAFMGLGYVLLIAAPLRILLRSQVESDRESSRASAADYRQPIVEAEYVADDHDASLLGGNDRPGGSFGWGVLIRPLLAHTVAMSLACIVAVSSLRRLYPQATQPLIWAFLCAVATWSAFAARRWTRSLWVWRSLPTSTSRLALYLLAFASIPAAVTLLLAVTVNRLAPQASILLPGWLIVAFIGLQAIVDAQSHTDPKKGRSNTQRWLVVDTTALTYPGYIGVALLASFVLFFYPQVTWLPKVMVVLGALLLAWAYAITHEQLTSASGRDR